MRFACILSLGVIGECSCESEREPGSAGPGQNIDASSSTAPEDAGGTGRALQSGRGDATAPDMASDASDADDAGSVTASTCGEPGDDCAGSVDCCAGATCITNGVVFMCAADCDADDQCSTACCASLEGGGGSVCSPATRCAPATVTWGEWCEAVARTKCNPYVFPCSSDAFPGCETERYVACCADSCDEASPFTPLNQTACLEALMGRSCLDSGQDPDACFAGSVGTASCPDLIVVADDGTFLGVATSDELAPDGVCNRFGSHGNELGEDSIYNPSGTYGSESSPESAYNELTSSPPALHCATSDQVFNAVSKNGLLAGAIDPDRLCTTLAGNGY